MSAADTSMPSTRWAPGAVRVLIALFVVAGLLGIPSVARAQFPGCTGTADVCTDGQVDVGFSVGPDCKWKATVDWGDGIVDNISDVTNATVARHIYASEGFYTVNITGSGTSNDPQVTCTWNPSSFTVQVVVVITPAIPPVARKDVIPVAKNGSLRAISLPTTIEVCVARNPTGFRSI